MSSVDEILMHMNNLTAYLNDDFNGISLCFDEEISLEYRKVIDLELQEIESKIQILKIINI